MTDIDLGLGFRGEILSDRKYAVGQGYEMTRTLKAHKSRPPVHTLRITAHVGNHTESHYAEVHRWDGQTWHEVVRLHATELADAPSYNTWTWTRETHRTARSTNDECVAWLDESGNAALAAALEVL